MLQAQSLTYRPRRTRDDIRGRAAAARVAAAGGKAWDQAQAHIEASFNEAAIINQHKRSVERLIRMSFGHPEVRARFRYFIDWFAANGIGLDEACALMADECRARHKGLARTIRAELHLALRWLRAKGMHAAFAETVTAVRAVTNMPTRVVAATSIVGGEFVVCDGDANGPVIGRFPRTEDGHRAAVAMAEG